MMTQKKAPSLMDLCVEKAINNVRYLGDVGDTEFHLLERILCHCKVDQLMHIENSTQGRDLSPVTDKFWKKFYVDEFGEDNFNYAVEFMREKKVTFKWKELYEDTLQEREEATQRSIDRVKQRYQQEAARKKSRQVQLCSKVPPSGTKRSFWGGPAANNIHNTKSSIMKKAKREFLDSLEVKNLATMKKTKVVQRNPIPSVPSKAEPATTTSGLAVSSTYSSSNKLIKPLQRRF